MGAKNYHSSYIWKDKIDIEFALTYDGRNDFWSYLAKSISIDLPYIIYATEIDKQRNLILNSWYKGKERQDLSSNRVRTFEGEKDFIKYATKFIAFIFKENLDC